MAKKTVDRGIFTLKERTYITPHYIRITLEGQDTQKFNRTTIGANNKIFLAPEGCDQVHLPEFDAEKGQWVPMDEAIRPSVRTYTHRGINLETNELYVDFVAHGDEGPASKWAIHAPIGAKLGVAMGTEASELYPEAARYILVGDATAIPVLGAILEDLPTGAQVKGFIEVETEADIQDLKTKAQADIEWIVNPAPGQDTLLAEKALAYIEEQGEMESKFAYVAAEFSNVKLLRNFLRKEKNWTKEELYAYSYWKFGKAENVSEADRRAEKASLD
ncbi:siderophore-interacting protein [Myroides odoratus]|uniref:siderophore-interacting protein n=1 Tax=Myroides odoratus TaxID=256 RepID=UPI000765F7B4|nr:siderophore-interacting protein [Myroides odoratus]